ncbi:MAG: dienelactone hydrolase family protein [Gammaproteobacteria bacterium]|nr:dienelactone hydrolase family protein [Gammaproteobacteria bacterium]
MNLSNKTIEFEVDGALHHAYMAWDQDVDGPRPGVMVIHEWWGLNDYVRGRADRLARLGYCGFAVDMYSNGETADNPEKAGELMNAVLGDMESGTTRLKAGYAAMLEQDQVAAGKTAAIGYCFGGAMVLHMARIGLELNAVVSFHGALGSFHSPAPGAVKASLLVCHGEDDAMVTMSDVAGFREEMDAAGADYKVIVHSDAQHGFSNPGADEKNEKYGLPVGYSARADSESWDAMIALFQRCF